MAENRGVLSSGWSMVTHNKRYIFWFWVLNVILAIFGTAAYRNQASGILDHSLYAGRLVHGFDLAVFIEMFVRPDFGPTMASTMSAVYFVTLFFVATALFLPGVFQGYASSYRLPRDQFFRACGRNLWRFIRLLIVAAIVFVIVGGILFSINAALVKHAGESTNELLPFQVRMTDLAVIFLVMTALRVWFDLAEADVVLNDQNAVRRSIGAGFRHMWRGLVKLVSSYVLIAIVAAIVLLGGIWVWMRFVPPDRVLRAFFVGQLTLFLLLIPRFWQRGVAIAYWQQKMMAPVVPMTVAPTPIMPAPVAEPAPPAPPETPAI
ncbi:MAG TPA: hypothetical protein VMU61_05720 [Candidatus Aquilonibacter sp.]|nr:hypothetical protein [Candidatus Aquilonibacter sp.]